MNKNAWIAGFGIASGLLVIAVVAVVFLSIKLHDDNNQIQHLKKALGNQNSSLQYCIRTANNSYNQVLQEKSVDPFLSISGLGSSLNASVNACKAEYP